MVCKNNTLVTQNVVHSYYERRDGGQKCFPDNKCNIPIQSLVPLVGKDALGMSYKEMYKELERRLSG